MTISEDFAALGITTIGAAATVVTAKIAADAIRKSARQPRRRGAKIRRLV